MIGFGILSILIALAAFGIPMAIGMISCIKYLTAGSFQISDMDAYAQPYESILDVSDAPSFFKPVIKKWTYAEAISMGVAPLMGVIFSFYFAEMKIPFDPLYSTSAISFIAVGYCSYWISRRFRQQLPLSLNLLLPYGIIIGIITYLFLFLHFISFTTVLAIAFASIIAFPLIAPLPATLFAIRQFQIQREFIIEKIKKEEAMGIYTSKWGKFLFWENSINPLALITFIIIILAMLFISGQPLDGFWKAFRGSEGFMFSIKGLNL